jgi:hypothetical protein
MLHFVTRRLGLRRYLKNPGDGRQQPQIPAQALLWALLVGQILRQSSFHAVEALVRSSARRTLAIAAPFCDDTLGYFTERLDPGATRQALLSLIRGAKRNKAFDDCRWIGLAIDGTGTGWRAQQGCPLCRPQPNKAKQIQGYQHSLVMISVVGTGLSLPFDGEPYGPGDSEYAAGQRLLRRVIGSLGKRFAQYVAVRMFSAGICFILRSTVSGFRDSKALPASTLFVTPPGALSNSGLEDLSWRRNCCDIAT